MLDSVKPGSSKSAELNWPLGQMTAKISFVMRVGLLLRGKKRDCVQWLQRIFPCTVQHLDIITAIRNSRCLYFCMITKSLIFLCIKKWPKPGWHDYVSVSKDVQIFRSVYRIFYSHFCLQPYNSTFLSVTRLITSDNHVFFHSYT